MLTHVLLCADGLSAHVYGCVVADSSSFPLDAAKFGKRTAPSGSGYRWMPLHVARAQRVSRCSRSAASAVQFSASGTAPTCSTARSADAERKAIGGRERSNRMKWFASGRAQNSVDGQHAPVPASFLKTSSSFEQAGGTSFHNKRFEL